MTMMLPGKEMLPIGSGVNKILGIHVMTNKPGWEIDPGLMMNLRRAQVFQQKKEDLLELPWKRCQLPQRKRRNVSQAEVNHRNGMLVLHVPGLSVQANLLVTETFGVP